MVWMLIVLAVLLPPASLVIGVFIGSGICEPTIRWLMNQVEKANRSECDFGLEALPDWIREQLERGGES